MFGNPMLGEHVENEHDGKFFGGTINSGQNELWTMVGSDMFRNPVLREQVENEQDGKVFEGTMNSGQNEDTLFCESVNNH